MNQKNKVSFLVPLFSVLWVMTTACSQSTYQFNPAEDDKLPQRGLKTTSEARLRIASRGYVASTLKEVFGPSAIALTNSLVTTQVSGFGGEPCDPNADAACVEQGGLSQLPVVPFGGAIRLSFVSRACQSIASLDAAILHAASLAGGSQMAGVVPTASTLRAPSSTNIAGVFDLFYAGKPLTEQVASDLRALVQATADGGANALEQWRVLAGTVCESPGWQVL